MQGSGSLSHQGVRDQSSRRLSGQSQGEKSYTEKEPQISKVSPKASCPTLKLLVCAVKLHELGRTSGELQAEQSPELTQGWEYLSSDQPKWLEHWGSKDSLRSTLTKVINKPKND